MYILTSPLKLPVGKKGWNINLNVYRNSHHRTLHNTKLKYKELMRPQIQELPPMEFIHIRYVLFPKTRRLCDVANVCSVTDKYFSDALVELHKIADDNYLYLPKVTYEFGSVNKDNPRVDIHITPINKET